jgi:hypothetical protein
VAFYVDVRACYCLGQVWLSKAKSKRRNGGTQALREEAAKSGAGGGNWTERLPIRFEWLAAA